MPVTYHCPNCGASMNFQVETGNLHCDHCGTSLTEEELGRAPGTERSWEEAMPEADSRARFKQYHCSACGAEILTDEHTIANICSFCGSPAIIEDRVAEELKPSMVIPFKITRDQAKDIYKKWMKSNPLVPDIYRKSETVEKITGAYVPFWLYDVDAEVDMAARCTRTRITRRGDTEYTHTEHYDVRRHIQVAYEKIPMDATTKMDDKVMSYLEPFDYTQLKPFEMLYLSGFQAEKYHFPSQEKLGEAKRRADQYATTACRDTINGYSSVNVTRQNVWLQEQNAMYVLLPVWLLVFRNGQEECTFAVNGQSGRYYGKLPASKSKAMKIFATVSAVSFAVLTVISLFGGFL